MQSSYLKPTEREMLIGMAKSWWLDTRSVPAADRLYSADALLDRIELFLFFFLEIIVF